MGKMCATLVFVVFFSVFEVANAQLNDGIGDIEIEQKNMMTNLLYIEDLLKTDLAEIDKLLKVKNGQKEQYALKAMKGIIEGDLEDVNQLKKNNVFSWEVQTELEWHNETINAVLGKIREVPDQQVTPIVSDKGMPKAEDIN